MFKKIPGSLYEISLDGKMIGAADEKVCTPSIHEGKVHIEMYGQMRHLDVRWLLIAHYEVDLPEPVKHRVSDITFKDVRRKLIRLKLQTNWCF